MYDFILVDQLKTFIFLTLWTMFLGLSYIISRYYSNNLYKVKEFRYKFVLFNLTIIGYLITPLLLFPIKKSIFDRYLRNTITIKIIDIITYFLNVFIPVMMTIFTLEYLLVKIWGFEILWRVIEVPEWLYELTQFLNDFL